MPNPHFDFRTAAGAERQRFDLPEGRTEAVIGRASDCGWVISSNAVSRRHARVFRQGSDFWVEDLGSSNGTFVNGERLSGPRMLRDQDLLQLGTMEATFVVPPPESEGDATIAVVSRPVPPPEPTPPKAAEPSPARPGTGTHTVASPPPPPPAAISQPPVRAETPSPSAPPPPVSPSGMPAVAPPAAPKEVPLPRPGGDQGGPSAAELALIAAGSFLLVFGIGAVLLRFVF
jgi:pSer/pThr/pTyr-binding forkhead associated (FHA) protein